MPILLLGHWRWFPIAHRTKRIRVLPPIRGKLSRGATMAAEWFVDRVVPKFGRTSPPGALQMVGWGSKNAPAWNASALR
jgi:hypothetical protein